QELAAPIYVDIKPGSWPNPIGLEDQGVLPVAICGTDEFDVHSIDPATVTLGCYYNDELVYPLRWSYKDVATPFLGEPGNDHALKKDGFKDLVLHFDIQEVIEAFSLASHAGEMIPLIITGEDISPLGAHFRGVDYVWILEPEKITEPPEFLRFYQGGLGDVAWGDADLSSETLMVNPYEVPYPEFLDEDEFSFEYTERNGYGLNLINCEKYPFSITEFRQALAYALDKYATAGAWGSDAQPHDSFISIANPYCTEGSLPVNYYDADLALGNQILDDAGFLDWDHDGFREAPDGSDFDVVVEYGQFSIIAGIVGETVVETLQNLGIDAVGWPHGSNEFFETLRNHEDFDMVFFGFGHRFDIVSIAEFYLSSNADVYAQNWANFRNDDYDFWFEQLQSAVDYSATQEAAFELQKIMAYECPIIVCYENYLYSAIRRPLENFWISAIQGMTNYETFANLEGIYPDCETVTSAVTWPGTLNPFRAAWWYGGKAQLNYGFNPMTLVYESLARLDINGYLVPQLAKTIDYNVKKQYIDIVLDDDTMWHNGKPFSVDDVVFTMAYFQDHPIGIFAEPCSHVDWVEIVDDDQVRIHLDYASYWNVEALLQVPILPQHIWMDIDDPVAYSNEVPIGTGPFSLYEYYGETTFGDPNIDLAGYQLVSGTHPESGTIITPEDGEYMIGVDFWSGELPLDYTITMTYDEYTVEISGSMTYEDIIGEGYQPSNAYEFEKLHFVWLPGGVEVSIVVDWNTFADLDIYFWSPSTFFNDQIYEMTLQRWPLQSIRKWHTPLVTTTQHLHHTISSPIMYSERAQH
ncbi:MAG: ABC transporter substrate-binding protein, partial [Promethearchaeota archaeon]